MLKPVPMAKVALVGPKTALEPTIQTLHELGILHIEDYTPGEAGFELGSPLPQGSQVSEYLLRVRGLIKGAQIPPPQGGRRLGPAELDRVQTELKKAEVELSGLVEKRNGLLDRLKRLDEEQELHRRIQHFPLRLDLLSGYESLTTATGFVPTGTSLDPLRAAHPDVEIAASEESEGTFLFVAAPQAERALLDALGKVRFQALEIPPTPATAAARLAAIDQERGGVRDEMVGIETEIAKLREAHAAAFYALDEHLSLLADRASAPVRFRTTRNSFMIEGWVPRDELSRLRAGLQSSTKNLVFVTELPTPLTQPWKVTKSHPQPAVMGAHAPEKGEHEEHAHAQAHATDLEQPPVHLANPRGAYAYQLLTDTYSRPKYTEVDPTLFFTFGFPFFFGLMLGDIAYGILIILLVQLGVFNKVYKFFGFESQTSLNRIFRHAGISSILFGLLYTEFFGLELFGHHGVISHYSAHFGPIPFPLARFENVTLLLLLSLAVAFVHMVIGLLVGMRNAAAAHGWGDAWKHRGSWLFVMLSFGLLGIAALPGILAGDLAHEPVTQIVNGEEEFNPWPYLVVSNPLPLYITGGSFLLIGLVLLLMGEGGIALLEIPTVISNLLSYTRLVAIGLSSAGIALAGNTVAGMVRGDGGVGGFIGASLVLVMFHSLNLALGVLGPALHSLRLHYVEFFTKFYEGGGKAYAPFRAERRYTAKEVKQA
jgi:V/A-type H+/Na+-transporting ATPase subunit I